MPPPKSKAGRRVVDFADLIVPDLRTHLAAIDQDDALVFTSPDGTPLRHSNFYRRAWMPALKAVGRPGVRLHDLRHTGNQLSVDAGANLRELMQRMGHDSVRAALIYQHATAERQRAIADQMGKNAKTALGKAKRSGTWMARLKREDLQGSAPGRIRTRDPLLRRHQRTVAACRLIAFIRPLSSVNGSWQWPGVA